MQAGNEQTLIFAERLQSLIAERGVQQLEVSEATGLTPTAISYYVRGRRTPGAFELRRLAVYFDVSMEWLLGGDSRSPSKWSVHDAVAEIPDLDDVAVMVEGLRHGAELCRSWMRIHGEAPDLRARAVRLEAQAKQLEAEIAAAIKAGRKHASPLRKGTTVGKRNTASPSVEPPSTPFDQVADELEQRLGKQKKPHRSRT